ncbi:hypothetical protein FOCG_18430 [Fusarium oxysporum f. sp. radicis-lycopersici 26381]|nr:hypothetical protein FOCG_18430 [Fusarium oxysporum f. sp. radicis-lycopersici 26381]
MMAGLQGPPNQALVGQPLAFEGSLIAFSLARRPITLSHRTTSHFLTPLSGFQLSPRRHAASCSRFMHAAYTL